MSSNRSFGILFFIVFIIIGLWPIKNSDSPNYVFLGIALIFLILGLVNSKALTPINKLWIKFGELLGKIIAPIIMAIVFFYNSYTSRITYASYWKRFDKFEI